ncbi:MAG: 30S ribosomal protein S8e [Nanoarchaeota archaeon]|nr:30S ribosomal protein S8e [Nanoarchaeota archaeon]
MAKSQFRSRRTVSGKRYKDVRKKRLGELAGTPTLTLIGKERVKVKRVKGGNVKQSLLKTEFVCVNEKGKTTKLAINAVATNPANIHYTRRNVITKGAIVKTEKGDVKITSRPGQSGVLFGVFHN